MTNRLLKIAAIAAACLMAAIAWTGCGGDKIDTQALEDLSNLPDTLTQMEANMDTMSKKMDALSKKELTVEVVEDGKTTSKWSQKDGSWRFDDPTDPTEYIIYNKQKNKTWSVSGKTAVEFSGANDMAALGYNPATMLGLYALIPKTGGSDDVWEFKMGSDAITIEFKGPDGLPSKVTSTSSGKTTVTEFKYSNVGSVSSSIFELPADVQVTSVESSVGGDGSANVTVPNGSDY
ncbi:MAG: hypothetical protein WC828_08055 [Thermoleophilia bacterium]|jgi:hypothetical protein